MAWLIPPVRARIKAVGALAEAADLPFPRPWARAVEVQTVEAGPGVVGDMYGGGQGSPVLIFVPGAALQGRRDPRVVQAARALAEADRRVFVPELALYERTFKRKDIERLVTAIESLSEQGPIGVVAFSYGGSFSLIAGALARPANDLSFVATFGAYFDLAHVIQGVTTGSTILDGDRIAFDTVPEAREIVISGAARLAQSWDGDELEEELEGEEPGRPGGVEERVAELLRNEEPARTEALIADLPEGSRKTLSYFSPSSHLDGIDFPVFVMQSKKDPATPWTEGILLERAIERSRLALLHYFSHVDPPGVMGWLSDGPESWRFISWILAEQE